MCVCVYIYIYIYIYIYLTYIVGYLTPLCQCTRGAASELPAVCDMRADTKCPTVWMRQNKDSTFKPSCEVGSCCQNPVG